MEPTIGEIRMVAFTFAPRNWAFCNGQLLPINQNQALFSILGTTYGGNGQTNFALPNLMGRTPVHAGQSPSVGQTVSLGQVGGSETHTLLTTQLPAHTHALQAATATATSSVPASNLLGNAAIYADSGSATALAATSIQATGGSQPHPNLPPYLTVNFIIALFGIYPSRS